MVTGGKTKARREERLRQGGGGGEVRGLKLSSNVTRGNAI